MSLENTMNRFNPHQVRTTSLSALAVALAGALVAGTVHAQSAPALGPQQQAINELECRTLLRLSGDERDFTLLYLHGFVSGRKNQLLLPIVDLSLATDKLIDRCIENPKDKALAVLEQVRQSSR